ncbi:MAG: ABC transporter substrate-binding protein [Oscillospiraceae bacterium]|jgi:NitT/TauT family transport system substrate-binding protein|nr:ABC transporter substrate-binding protein [Oscillospiraceae bacterium]
MKHVVAFVLALGLALSLAACGGDAETGGAPSARGDGTAEKDWGKIELVGKSGSLCAAPTYIAYENGYFAEEGFDVTLITADGETRKVGLNNGTLPLTNTDFQFFPPIAQGMKFSVVEGLHYGCISIVVKPDSGITEPADLVGKTIGIDEMGSSPFQVASAWLAQNGIDIKTEVEIVPFGADGNLQIEALKNGEIDATALWDPFGTVAEEREGFVKIFDLGTHHDYAGKYCCFLFASDKVLDEEPEKIASLLRAYHKAQDWIAKNPYEAAKIVIDKKYVSTGDYELASELLQSYRYPTYEDRKEGKPTLENDIRYFITELAKIDFLQTDDPEAFAKRIYRPVETNDYE